MVVAIAADEVEDMAALQTRMRGIVLLTDPGLTVLRAWGALLPGAEHPSPITFVVRRDERISYRHPLDEHGDWPPYANVFDALSR